MDWLARTWEVLRDRDLSEVIRNYAIIMGGIVGIAIAWMRVRAANRQAEAQIRQADAQIRQADLTRRDHVAELFNRAVGQLKDDKLEVRLGAIYTLRQVCRDFSDLSDPVVQLLTAYLRESAIDYGDAEPPIDVREILATVRERLEWKR